MSRTNGYKHPGRSLVLAALAGLVSGCAGAPPARPADGPRPDPRPRPATPAARPAPDRPAVSPLLAQLHQALRGNDGSPAASPVIDLAARYRPLVAQHGGKPVPAGATLQAVPVRQGQRLLGAVLAVVPRTHVRCSTERDERPTLYWVAAARPGVATATDRWPEVDTRALDSTKPRVELPVTYPQVPFMAIRFDPECPAAPGGGRLYSDQKTVEVFALTPGGLRLLKRFESYRYEPAGRTEWVSVELDWVKAQRGTFYLVATEARQFVTPYTSMPTGAPGERRGNRTSGVRTFTVYSLTPAGVGSQIPAAQLPELRRLDPELERVLSDRE
jgi:hypothetical protein